MKSIFDSKYFNGEVFGRYLDTIPRVKTNAFLTSGIFRNRTDLKSMLSAQTGGNYITIPMAGRIGGAPVNYDGDTDITTTGIGSYAQSMAVVGRAKGWEEKDFTFDITGHDFMRDIAAQVSEYWDDIDELTVLATLEGIYAGSSAFQTNNTYDISNASSAADQYVGPATLNNAIQQAAGSNKNIFTMAIMHSQVATNLENLELLEYRKYTDANGIQRNLSLADWNGRTVLVDDDVPTQQTYTSGGVYTVTIGGTPAVGDVITVLGEAVTLDSTSAASTTAAATAVVTALGTLDDYSVNRSTATITFTEKSGHYGAGVPTASVSSGSGSTVTVATTTAPVSTTTYTTYILGRNAITYCDCGAKIPYETARQALTDGGIDMLITRQRKLFAPFGWSYTMPAGTTSPTDAQLKNAAYWGLVRDTTSLATINTKAIPICRIISKG